MIVFYNHTRGIHEQSQFSKVPIRGKYEWYNISRINTTQNIFAQTHIIMPI